ncbi:MAG: hypothetical protein ACFFDN_13490 [Candidatus Hodarchaeota archaeon]
MKKNKQIISIIFMVSLSLNFFAISPQVVAPPPSLPDHLIAEFFPNSTLPLQLIHSNTIIIINATDFPNKIGIDFNANYTIYNLGNTTKITFILPLSLARNVSNFMFDVYINNSQIPYDLFNVSPWNENISVINVSFYIIELYPITLIRSNTTLLKNSTTVIGYHFSGSIDNPLDSRDLIYLVYNLGTSQEWIGNTTGKLEFRVYGKKPIFSRMGFSDGWQFTRNCTLIDINGVESYICEWDNIEIPHGSIGLEYYKESSPFEEIWLLIILNLALYVLIGSIIAIVVLARKKRKKNL